MRFHVLWKFIVVDTKKEQWFVASKDYINKCFVLSILKWDSSRFYYSKVITRMLIFLHRNYIKVIKYSINFYVFSLSIECIILSIFILTAVRSGNGIWECLVIMQGKRLWNPMNGEYSFCWSKVSFVESQAWRTLIQRMSCWKDSSLWLRRLLRTILRANWGHRWSDLDMSLPFDGKGGSRIWDKREVLFIGRFENCRKFFFDIHVENIISMLLHPFENIYRSE